MAETNGTRTMTRSYADDYAGWLEDTACAIEEGRFGEIELAELADEVRDLGIGHRKELVSALRIPLLYLLKTKYQPEKESRSWQTSIRVQRKHIGKFLLRSPSLRRELPELLEDAYDDARIDAANETGIVIDVFPEFCEWTVDEVLEAV